MTITNSKNVRMLRGLRCFLCSVLLLVGTFACCQQGDLAAKEHVSIQLTTFNHAAELMDGQTTYLIEGNTLKVRITNRFSATDTLVFSEEISDETIQKIRNIELESLDRIYINNCIMLTSGNEYYLSLTKGSSVQKCWLHCYYHPKIEQLFNEINLLLPDKYRYDYLSKYMKQDCDP